MKENEKIKTTDQNIYLKLRKMLNIILDFLLKWFWIITEKQVGNRFIIFFWQFLNLSFGIFPKRIFSVLQIKKKLCKWFVKQHILVKWKYFKLFVNLPIAPPMFTKV